MKSSANPILYAILGLSIMGLTPSYACTSPSQPKNRSTTIDMARVRYDADRLLRGAESVVVATVIRPPRPRRRSDVETPPPGLLKVDEVLKGRAPKIVQIHRTDPCLIYFQKIGETGIVTLRKNGNLYYPSFLPKEISEEIKRRLNLGYLSTKG